MKSRLPAATPKQSKRIDIIKREIGCIACWKLYGWEGVPADAHHLISKDTGCQISHDHTIPLCKNHHVGRCGIHTRKLWFMDTFGTDEVLLELTNIRYEEIKANTIGGSL